MDALIGFAYFAAVMLWIPLAVIAANAPAARPHVMVPLVASAIAAAVGALMTLALGPLAVRVDILFAMIVLCFVDGLSGLYLLVQSRIGPVRNPLVIAGVLCLGVAALAIAAYATGRQDMVDLDRNIDLKYRFLFEAYFRDDETQKRAFGDLTPDKNPWAGYYAGLGDDDRMAHLVINDAGRFWIFHSSLSKREGAGRQSAESADVFEGEDEDVRRRGSRVKISLRRQDTGPFVLEVDFNPHPGSEKSPPARMRKADPPRYPRPITARDEVRFEGVFSGTHDESRGKFSLVQVWLWESGGRWWGHYLHEQYTRGISQEFIDTEMFSPVCSEQCRVLSFSTRRTSGRTVTLARDSADEFTATVPGEYRPTIVKLRRGETVPGFYYDLAPVATRKAHEEWMTAVLTAGFVTWKVPPPAEESSSADGREAGRTR